MRILEVLGSLRAAWAARNESLTGLKCPSTQTSNASDLGRCFVEGACADWRMTWAFARAAAGSSATARGCRTMSRDALASAFWALRELRMSRYRSVPVRARMIGLAGYRRAKRWTEGKLRRACSATR